MRRGCPTAVSLERRARGGERRAVSSLSRRASIARAAVASRLAPPSGLSLRHVMSAPSLAAPRVSRRASRLGRPRFDIFATLHRRPPTNRTARPPDTAVVAHWAARRGRERHVRRRGGAAPARRCAARARRGPLRRDGRRRLGLDRHARVRVGDAPPGALAVAARTRIVCDAWQSAEGWRGWDRHHHPRAPRASAAQTRIACVAIIRGAEKGWRPNRAPSRARAIEPKGRRSSLILLSFFSHSSLILLSSHSPLLSFSFSSHSPLLVSSRLSSPATLLSSPLLFSPVTLLCVLPSPVRRDRAEGRPRADDRGRRHGRLGHARGPSLVRATARDRASGTDLASNTPSRQRLPLGHRATADCTRADRALLFFFSFRCHSFYRVLSSRTNK